MRYGNTTGKMRIKITKEDKDWSKAVRSVGYCEWPISSTGCEYNSQVLHAHHIFPRSRKATRHDVENGIALCPGHHVFANESAHKSPELFRRLMKKVLGKKYKILEKRSLPKG